MENNRGNTMAAKKKISKKTGLPVSVGGRPKGSPNKTTLFKEVMKHGFEAELEKDFLKVVRTVIEKAKDGDMTAAKMLFDRAVPVTKAVDINANDLGKTGGISINIERLVATDERKGDIIDGEIIEDTET